MQIEVHNGKHVDAGTSMSFTEDGIRLDLPADKRTPHPDLINAMGLFDAHCACLVPYLTREGDIKRKQLSEENPETKKIEKWFRPLFNDLQMADDFHCTGFHVNDKGAVGLHCTVKQEGKGSTGFNIKPKPLVQGDMFEAYEYLQDLKRVLKLVQKEFELYRNGKVDPRSKMDSTGEEEVPGVEKTVTGIAGVGGKPENDGETFEQIEARAKGTKGAAAKGKRGRQQTPDNPSGQAK